MTKNSKLMLNLQCEVKRKRGVSKSIVFQNAYVHTRIEVEFPHVICCIFDQNAKLMLNLQFELVSISEMTVMPTCTPTPLLPVMVPEHQIPNF